MTEYSANLETGVHCSATYFPIPIDAFQSDQLAMELYLIHAKGNAVLFRKPGTSYSRNDCQKLIEQGITHLYVPKTQHRIFQAMINEQLVDAYQDENISRAERTRIVRASCAKMIEEFMLDPTIPGLSETLGGMATQFSNWCNEDESKFSHLLNMSEHDFYTTTHMVNVGVGCGLLGAELLGSDAPMVRDLMLGGLVHDVGKSQIPPEILNKEGKLTDEEWTLIREHPKSGYDILKNQEGQNEITLEMALSHHERLDGKGYPNGVSAGEIGFHARVCAVVDIYDALTSSRPYRGPIPPRTTLDMMRKDLGTAIDGEIFAAWERVIHRMLAEDPERAVPEGSGMAVPNLSELMPSPATLAEVEPMEKPQIAEVGILRSTGESLSVELVSKDFDQILIRSDVRFKASEKVRLVLAGESEQGAVFSSMRFSSCGEMLSAFKFEDAHKAA
tara:strand:- start:89114 stop:90451 length:1338 start_codon:yes stop_codon:yes gene_type:complete